ncbi:hypothetical protein HYH03_012211 [Edaphochlamys debaryana]|uniref:Uncharacterized protein n=1 Tax=Edaphochlamys debaryana TaxID=47281 RepID=A0A835XW07_9CHLO|nr:hypothetical protein HYH03_012211 [Edaphochlamys debaryana]|eukprot:KAG2489381.1 hypothetical protein HYH03_012211 [Edaphochlamys debaryana]
MHQLALSAGVAALAAGAGFASLKKLSAPTNAVTSARPAPNDADEVADQAEARAEEWLASRKRTLTDSPVPLPSPCATYSEVELLSDSQLVYMREGANVLTTTVPLQRRLATLPLQLPKGRPDAVPTAALEPNSVWVVRRRKQVVAFELFGQQGRHFLEADPSATIGVSLGGGRCGKACRWLITPQGLASERWPEHLLPLQVFSVALVDVNSVASVKSALGRRLAELHEVLECEAEARCHAEARCGQLESDLRKVKDSAAAQASELRAQVDNAVRARHAAERDAAVAQGIKQDEAVRAKIAQARASQAELEAQTAATQVRQLQQQIQGMIAGHAEELRTLQNELQLARESNEGLKRAMHEQVMALQGALELRDSRIVQLEEENDRMDTVLQVIQAQISPSASGGFAAMGADGSARGDAVEGDASASGNGDAEAAAMGAGDVTPLWRSVLDLTGDLSLTALKESLALTSRRSTVEGQGEVLAEAEEPAEPHQQQPAGVEGEAAEPLSVPDPTEAPEPADPTTVERPPLEEPEPTSSPRAAATALPGPRASGADPAGPRAFALSPSVSASLGSAGSFTAAAGAGEWGSGGGAGSSGEEAEFIPMAARLSSAGSWASGRGGGSSGGGGQSPAQVKASAPGVPGVAQDGGVCGATSCSAFSCPQAAGAAFSAEPDNGVEAVLTLDSLRRRMRELELELSRCQLLSQSLQAGLPWRSSVANASGLFKAAAAAAAPAAEAGLMSKDSSGSSDPHLEEEEAQHEGRPVLLDEGAGSSGVHGSRGTGHASRSLASSTAWAGGAGADDHTGTGEQGPQHQSGGGSVLASHALLCAASLRSCDGDAIGAGGEGPSGDWHPSSLRTSANAGEVEAGREGNDGEGLGCEAHAGEEAASGPTAPSGAASGRPPLPELRLDRVAVRSSVYVNALFDSVDGMCNLASTRAPTASHSFGALTARQVGAGPGGHHSRQPSFGRAEAVRLSLSVAPLDAVPRSPAPSTPPGAALGAATTPKSCAGSLAAEDDSQDLQDQEVQDAAGTPPAMLLGTLDELRGAGAASAAKNGGAHGGLLAGRRALAALEEDDEE